MRAPHWRYRDPLEAELGAAVSADHLMAHARTIASWERESGSPGEAQAFDYIERVLKGYGLAIERRQIDAYISLPEDARIELPDGHRIEALTHSFSASTPGLEAELVDGGDGTPAELERAGARGRIALIASFATPGKAWDAERAGAAGQVYVNVDHLHNMIVTTIWGTPTPETAWRIPATPCASIRRADAERLRARLGQGPLRVRLVTRVATGWVPIPHLTAELPGLAEERFALFSGHVDAWHHGAMDNGTANATMLEVARLLAARRGALRRGMRFAFWSGHSHGRYAGSAWYADQSWEELHRRCVLHLNVDSTGARGATDYSVFHATEDAQSFAEAVVADVTGQSGRARRYSRAADQSFWGIGIPSAFMSMSQLPPQDTEFSRTSERLFGTAGYPWWWHTREDTIDKIDPAVLALDTRVYVTAALRLLQAPVLPLDPARMARALGEVVGALAAGAAGRAELARSARAVRRLAAAAEGLGEPLGRLAADGGPAEALLAANGMLLKVSRELVALSYTTGDRFAHDLALPVPPLPGLQQARDLGRLDPASDVFRFTAAALVREENRVVRACEAASDLIDEWAARSA